MDGKKLEYNVEILPVADVRQLRDSRMRLILWRKRGTNIDNLLRNYLQSMEMFNYSLFEKKYHGQDLSAVDAADQFVTRGFALKFEHAYNATLPHPLYLVLGMKYTRQSREILTDYLENQYSLYK
jgi:hypothetical protein